MAAHSSVLAWEIPWTEEPERAVVLGAAKGQTQLSDWARLRPFLLTRLVWYPAFVAEPFLYYSLFCWPLFLFNCHPNFAYFYPLNLELAVFFCKALDGKYVIF